MLSQRLQQKLLQKLSPQQIQLMKLLQIPTIALEQRIKQEIEENPALEEGPEEEVDNVQDEFNEDLEEDDGYNELENEEFSLSDYIDDDDTPYYKYDESNISPDDQRKEIPTVSGLSFQDHLIAQLGLKVLDDKQYQIGLHIIGNIDDSGYLQRDLNAMVDDLIFTQNIAASVDEIKHVLDIIQEFEPAGVGATSLQECLILQLKRKYQGEKVIALAIQILEKAFDEFVKKHYDKIIKKLDISEKELKEAVDEILKLNPKPGNSMIETSKTTQYIIPDFTIVNVNGQLELTINSRNAPELRLSKTYLEMAEAYSQQKNKKDNQQKEAFLFVKQKLDSAKWFIEAIQQRQNTLYVTMEAIMNYQKEFFLTGDEAKLKPMILKDIADKVGLDISTISRVANSKYVQTPFGTYLLKYFFSESLQTDSGEEVSTREVKKILMDCISNEDKRKPVTDEELAKILNEKGYNIARRTIAKYREQLNIPVARLRKEL